MPRSRTKATLSETEAAYLKQLYTDPNSSSAYAGAGALYKRVKDEGVHAITLSNIREWLRGLDSYTVHRPARKKILRNRIVVRGIDHVWHVDLSDMQKLAKFNRGVRYLFCSIDSMSKYACVRPLKNKKGVSVVSAFTSVFRERGKPELVNSDKGSEFRDKRVQNYLKKEGVGFYFSENPEIKASIVERFQRTLKQRLFRYMTENNTLNYIGKLQNIVRAYNHSFHRSIGITPAEVNKSNEDLVWSRLYGRLVGPYPDFSKFYTSKKFNIGDTVRLSKTKMIFEKGYTPNWTDELFIVHQIIPRRPFTVYKVKDMLGEVLSGTFYPPELERVNKTAQDTYKIEKTLRRKKIRGVNHYLVKWLNYPEKFNSWVSEQDMVSLN